MILLMNIINYFKEMDADKKKKWIIFGSSGVVVLVAVIVLIVVLCNREESYRLIKVFEYTGTVTITRENTDMSAYESMLLESGDIIKTGSDGAATLRLDDDKYIYIEANTELELVATGTAETSRTFINLLEGTIINDIRNKLNAESSYEINTPNSTMAVRGTIYLVNTYVENGVRYTKVSVFDGSVTTDLIFGDGSNSGVNTIVGEGNEVIIFDDGQNVDYLEGVTEIDFDELPDDVLEILSGLSREDGSYDDIVQKAQSELDSRVVIEEEEDEGPFTVTFLNSDNSVFATQEAEKDSYIEAPILMPTESGHWDYDFSQPVNEDTEIKWVEE